MKGMEAVTDEALACCQSPRTMGIDVGKGHIRIRTNTLCFASERWVALY